LKFFPLQRVPEFVAGMCCALLAEQARPANGQRPWIALLIALGLSVTACALLPSAFLFCGVLTPAFAILVCVLDRWGSRWLENRVVLALGDASYATYILHVPWFYTLRRIAGVDQLDAPLFAVYFGSLLLLSLGARFFIEEPLRKRIGDRLRRPSLLARSELRDAPHHS
jgi:peptidoglycan/LPS O-acetylase OafA/YrhL